MKLTISEAAKLLQQHDDYVILTHHGPDGDTLGSAGLLCRGLQAAGKKAAVLENPKTTPKLAFLTEGLCCSECKENQMLIAVDVAAAHLLPPEHQQYSNIFLRIDHHANDLSFTDHELVRPESASCAELIYQVLAEMGVKLDKFMAEALYTGLSTDTGCFRYANTTAHAYRTAAVCLEAGADIPRLNRELFEVSSLRKLQAQSYLTEHARFLQDGQGVVCVLPYEIYQKLQLTEDDLDNISGFPRSIEGVKIAATVRQRKDGTMKISVRAVPGYDARSVCEVFGGGGHKGAAGARSELPMEQVVDEVARQICRVLSEGAI